jgi:hypothetical protein
VSPKTLPKATVAEDIPGETEEDGMLRREYVLVDEGPAVEFHKKVDGTCTLNTSYFRSVHIIYRNTRYFKASNARATQVHYFSH